MSFVYVNKMRKCQDRLNTSLKLKLLDSFQMLYSSMCFGYIITHRTGEGTMRWILENGVGS